MNPVTEESATQALAQLGGKATFTEIAKALREPTRGQRTEPLKQILKQLVAEEKIFLKGSTYTLNLEAAKRLSSTPQPDTAVEPPTESDADKVIEAIEKLKKDFKYPATPKEIAESSGFRFDLRFKALLTGLVDGAALQTWKSGKTSKYLFSADDPRYAQKATEKLKFELLEEIRNLRCELELSRATSAGGTQISRSGPEPVERAPEPIPYAVVERILPAIKKISKKKKRRSVLISDLRTELEDLDSPIFEAALETLGDRRELELHLLQDGAKLNEKQKQGLLRLSDGRLIASVALSED